MQQKIGTKIEKMQRQFRKRFPTKRICLKNGVTFTIRRLDDWRFRKVADAVQQYTYGFAWEQTVAVKIKPNATIYLTYLSKPCQRHTVARLANQFKHNYEKAVRSASIIVYPCEITEKTVIVKGTILTSKVFKCFFPGEATSKQLLNAILTGVPPTVLPLINTS